MIKIIKSRATILGILLFTASLLHPSQAQTSSIDWTDLFEKNKDSVVSITVTGTSKQNYNQLDNIPEELLPFFQLPRTPRKMSGSGSGFVIDGNGVIITNAHVVKDADEITVHLSDHREFPAKLLGIDEKSDVAVLEITQKGLSPVTIGEVSKLKVGQPVLAIGSPFGLDYTATQGIISSLARSLPNDSYTPFIQTDAAVNPGNSGGPLFSADGKVIGINSQIYSRTGSYAGISFAIPIDIAMDVVDQLKANGQVTRGWIGVMIQEITPDLAESFNMKKPEGALVGEVMEGGPAQKAGLLAGDIIQKFNNIPIQSSRNLPTIVSRTKPNSTAELEVLRDGNIIKVPVTIGKLEDEGGTVKSLSTGNAGKSNRLGLTLKPSENHEGLQIVGISPDSRTDLQEGDIILQVNNKSFKNVKEFNEIMRQFKPGQIVRMLVKREDATIFMAVKIPN